VLTSGFSQTVAGSCPAIKSGARAHVATPELQEVARCLMAGAGAGAAGRPAGLLRWLIANGVSSSEALWRAVMPSSNQTS
jgi:hypothetical protein